MIVVMTEINIQMYGFKNQLSCEELLEGTGTVIPDILQNVVCVVDQENGRPIITLKGLRSDVSSALLEEKNFRSRSLSAEIDKDNVLRVKFK